MELSTKTFRSAFERTLPRVGGLRSFVLNAPRVVDDAITAGSVNNARDAMRESELRHEAEGALKARRPLGEGRTPR